MAKVVKYHTCRCHIWCDGGKKASWKGTRVGCLENGAYCTHVSVSQSSELGQPMLRIRVGQQSRLLKFNHDFFVKLCDINFQTSWKVTPIAHLYYTCAKLLTCNENVCLPYTK